MLVVRYHALRNDMRSGVGDGTAQDSTTLFLVVLQRNAKYFEMVIVKVKFSHLLNTHHLS